MAEQEVKNQHFVPRTYLKHFAEKRNKNYYIKALSIANPLSENIEEKNTKKICFEKHLYTLPGNTVRERMLLEKFYGDEFEQHYNAVYDMLVNPQKNQLTEAERELIIGTVTTMLYRVPRWIKQHNEVKKRIYKAAFDFYEQTGKDQFSIGGIKVSVKGKTLEEFLEEDQVASKPSQVITQLEAAMALVPVRLANDNIFIIKLEDADSKFITSDNPVIIQNIDGGLHPVQPFNPSNIMKLPLDCNHILMLMPTGPKEDRHIIRRNNSSGIMCKREAVISNTEQFQGADINILGSENSLNMYLKTKELAEKPRILNADGMPDAESLEELRNAGLL